jgi:hypothetical protein
MDEYVSMGTMDRIIKISKDNGFSENITITLPYRSTLSHISKGFKYFYLGYNIEEIVDNNCKKIRISDGSKHVNLKFIREALIDLTQSGNQRK